MSLVSNLVILGVVAAVAVVAVGVLKARAGGAQGKASLKAKPVLTANELEFLGRLEAAMPELRFCPQVSMGALLEPGVPRSDQKAYFRLRGMFSQKIVDFVAQDRSDGKVVAVIELDDRTHDQGRDQKRDEMLTSAGYRIVRWNSKNKPDATAIRTALLGAKPELGKPSA